MSNGHVWIKFKNPSDVERVRTAFLVKAAELGLTWIKPRFDRASGAMVGGSLTTIIDTSVLTPGRMVFCGKPEAGPGLKVLEPEIVVNKGLFDDAVDTSILELPAPETIRNITKSAGVELHVAESQSGLKSVVYDLSLKMELVTQNHGVVTVEEAAKIGGKIRCQSPFRDSDSWACLFSVDSDGAPLIYDFGTCTTHRLPVVEEFQDLTAGGEMQEGASKLRDCLIPLVSVCDASDFLPHCLNPWIPYDEVTLLAGHGGGGKSYTALLIAVHVALGLPFGSMMPTQSKVLFFSAEDGAQVLRHRLAKICRALKLNPIELEDKLFMLDASDIDPALHREQYVTVNGRRQVITVTPLLDQLATIVRETNAGLVIIDNASDTYDDDEIKRGRVRAFIRSLRSQIARPGRAVLMLAHVNKASAVGGRSAGTEDYSGSTAWHNSVRSRLSLAPDANNGLTIEHVKANLGQKGAPVRLAWRDGVPVVVGAMSFADAEAAQAAEKLRDDADKSALVEMVQEFDSRGERVTTSFQGNATVYKLLKGQPGFPKNTNSERLMRLLRELETEGRIYRRLIKTPDRKQREAFTCVSSSGAADRPAQ